MKIALGFISIFSVILSHKEYKKVLCHWLACTAYLQGFIFIPPRINKYSFKIKASQTSENGRERSLVYQNYKLKFNKKENFKWQKNIPKQKNKHFLQVVELVQETQKKLHKNEPLKHKNPEEDKYPHFRKYFKANHPALITGEYSDVEFNYRKVTHSDKEGRHLNEKVDPNPNPSDKEPMFIVKRVRHDNKKNFSTWIYPWKYK